MMSRCHDVACPQWSCLADCQTVGLVIIAASQLHVSWRSALTRRDNSARRSGTRFPSVRVFQWILSISPSARSSGMRVVGIKLHRHLGYLHRGDRGRSAPGARPPLSFFLCSVFFSENMTTMFHMLHRISSSSMAHASRKQENWGLETDFRGWKYNKNCLFLANL